MRRLCKKLNEKNLVLLLIILPVITIFIIFMNLPSDLNRSIEKIRIEKLFVNEFILTTKQIITKNNENEENDEYKQQLHVPNDEQDSLVKTNNNTKRLEKIREMALFAWSNYEKYAWGENELRPITKTGHSASVFGQSTKLGATIVDGLDTMYLMGFKDEYERGREWILKNLNMNVNSDVSAFEINIRFVGGLLSLYTLTGDKEFIKKAEEIATTLLPCFESPTGIPYALINPQTKSVKNYNWASGLCSILSEFGSFSLEFKYLSDLTGNKIFAQKIEKIFETLSGVNLEFGLYYNYLNPINAKWCMKHASIGALGDSFYEYLLKLYLYENKKDQALFDMYIKSMEAIKKSMLDVSSKDKLAYFGDLRSGRIEKKMGHLACFTGGLLALTSIHTNTVREKDDFMSLAKNVTNTCHESYLRTATGIGPEYFHFERESEEAMSVKNDEKVFLLRPEVAESYFYLWRLTKDVKYREWAWEIVLALEKHCRTESGYTGLSDVYQSVNTPKDNVMQSFFIAELLKYLFLIFSEDDVLPLDKYVFNTEAHPFLIKT